MINMICDIFWDASHKTLCLRTNLSLYQGYKNIFVFETVLLLLLIIFNFSSFKVNAE